MTRGVDGLSAVIVLDSAGPGDQIVVESEPEPHDAHVDLGKLSNGGCRRGGERIKKFVDINDIIYHMYMAPESTD